MAFSIWRCILQRRPNVYHGNVHSKHGSPGQLRTFCVTITRSPFKAERVQRPRGSLWRTRKIISNEALTVIRRMIRHTREETQLAKIVKTDFSRLLKIDMMSVFKEFIRERRPDLARMVLGVIKKEPWYKPELFIYKDIMLVYAKKHRAKETEELFEEMKQVGLEPELNTYTELLRAYVYTFQVEKIHKTVDEMKEMGCHPDLQVYRLLTVGLYSVGERQAAKRYRMELYRAQHLNQEPPPLPNEGEPTGFDDEDTRIKQVFPEDGNKEENDDVSDDDEYRKIGQSFREDELSEDEDQPMDGDDET